MSIAALALSLVCGSTPASLELAGAPVAPSEIGAQDPSPPPQLTDADPRWRTSLTPYLWMFAMEGDVRINGTEASFDASFGDIWDNLDFALMARLEAWHENVGFYLDPLYGKLEADADAGAGSAEVETELTIIDFGVLYRVLDRPTEKGRARIVDVYAGGRYMAIENDVDFDVLPDRGSTGDTLDLTLGARYAMDVTDRLGFLVGGDVGGFDLGGSATDFTWNAQALGSFAFGKSGRLWAGYRVLDVDDDKGGATGTEVEFAGPIVGYEFRF